jgi:DNA-binding HxlR family transcriptional regulator
VACALKTFVIVDSRLGRRAGAALRDVWVGIRRFDAIQADLGISRKVLTERLQWLVECAVLERQQYSGRPARYEYLLTAKGNQLCDVLLLMARWGDRWLAGDAGPPALYRHHDCGKVSHLELHCSHCHQPMSADNIDVLPGPGATS